MTTENAKPSPAHLDHLQDGIMAIVHFGLNTYCDKEWGYGDTSPSLFNPAKLDTDQWAEAMLAGEIRRVVMVTKHHDGFNLWPSPLNKDYTIANAPWKNGRGDLVREICESCRKKGLHFGVYLSPWDRHQATYGTPAYTEYYHRQFDDLFSNFGDLCEIWLDGANGGDGWYGGANERRKLAGSAWEYYRMPEVIAKMCEKFPRAIAFGGHGPHSAVWIGNEQGFAPDAVWYETPRGYWETPECDTPLRKGWFWHQDEAPKSLARLVEIYFSSVGRGCVMNLGIAPNRDGLVGDDDVKRLKEFGDYVRRFNALDLADGAESARDGQCVTLKLRRAEKVNCVDIMEEIADGQKISAWKLEARIDGQWRVLVNGGTVGYRRLERFDEITAQEFRVTVTDGKDGAKLGKIAFRRAEKVAAGADDKPPMAPLFGEKKYFEARTDTPANEYVCEFLHPMNVKAFQFYPANNDKILVDRYEVHLSDDGKNWNKIKEGEFSNILANPVPQMVYFNPPVKVKFIKFVATHAIDAEPVWNHAVNNFILMY